MRGHEYHFYFEMLWPGIALVMSFAVRHGYRHLATDYVFGSDMILSFERSPS